MLTCVLLIATVPHAQPVNNPSLPLQLPSMLLTESSPLAFARPITDVARWATRPQTLRWLALFLANCRPDAVDRSAAALASLLQLADAGWTHPLAALTTAERAAAGLVAAPAWLGCLYLFPSIAAAEEVSAIPPA